jgi:hypothetical protein
MPAKKLSQLKRQKVKRRVPVAPPGKEHKDPRAIEKALPSGRGRKHKKADEA